MSYEDELITKIAWLYYIDNMTQQEIGNMLDISRMRVVRLLEKGRAKNIIQLKIRRDLEKKMRLESDLIKKYKLKDTFIVPSSSSASTEDINSSIATAAAIYLDDKISNNELINIGYGDTSIKTINKLSVLSNKKISFVSLTGGVSLYILSSHSVINNSNLYLLPAPLLASTKEMVQALKKEKAVIDISLLNNTAKYTVVGIGAMNDQATILNNGILSSSDFAMLKMNKAVGDVLSYFFDKDGNLVDCHIYEKLISVPYSEIKKLNNVVGVAAGPLKREAIKGALNGGYIDILITDEDTAKWLNKEER